MTRTATAYDQVLDVLRTAETFCLSGHQNPDADVVGSQLAVMSLIERIRPGRSVDIVNSGMPPRTLSHLPGFQKVRSTDRVTGHYDALIVFECSGADRMGSIIDFASQVNTVVNIDHHLHNPNFGHVNLVEPETSSTAELIFKIIRHAGLDVTRQEAICLYTGLTADTGWFRYGNTNVQSHLIAAELLRAGVPVADLAERAHMSRTPAAMELLSWVLSHRKLYYNNRLAVLTLPEEVFRGAGAQPDDTDEIVNHGLLMDCVQVSALLKEKTGPSVVKISLRSKGDVDINQIARAFGGGGHKNASGCGMTCSLDEAEKALVAEMSRLFR